MHHPQWPAEDPTFYDEMDGHPLQHSLKASHGIRVPFRRRAWGKLELVIDSEGVVHVLYWSSYAPTGLYYVKWDGMNGHHCD